ncbi:MAG: BatA domain-containing protein [Planctomycetota bacterium]
MGFLSQFFLNPAFFLPGAALVILPILIHILSRLRYRRVRFAAMEFLLESEELNRRRILLEQLLQLFLRILAILLITLLIARLLLDPGRLLMLRGASRHHVVLLDDTLSLRERDGESTLFQRSLATLETMLVEGVRQSGSARVTILPLSDPRRPIISDRVLDSAFVQELIPRLRNQPCTFRSASPVPALNAARDLLSADASADPHVHILTDFRAVDWSDRPEVTAAFASLKAARAQVDLIQVSRGDAHPNIAIAGITTESLAAAQGVPWRVTLQVRNHSNSKAAGLRAAVLINGTPVPSKILIPDIEPAGQVEVSHDLAFDTEGRQQVEVRLDDDNLREDNRRVFAVEVAERRSVLILDDDGQQEDAAFVAAAISADPALTGLTAEIRTSQALNASELPRYDCIYLLNIRDLPADTLLVLADYVRSGGGIVWFPGDQANVAWYSETLRTPGNVLFPVPLGVIQDVLPETPLNASAETLPFASPVFAPHPIFTVYNAPDSPFPDTVRISRYFRTGPGWKVDDVERGDGVRTIMRLQSGESVGFEHSPGGGRILTFLTGAGRRWSNWPIAPAAPGYVVMHLLTHQYLQKPVSSIQLRELAEPLQLQWPATEFTDAVEVYLPETGVDDEPAADTFARLQATPVTLPQPPASGTDAPGQPAPGSPAAASAGLPQLSVAIPQASRPGLYRIRRFRPDGAVSDLAVALNVPPAESPLAIADPPRVINGPELDHVRLLNADAAGTLGGSAAGRELRWILLGLLACVLIAEQLVSLRLSYHPEAAQ